MLILALLAAPAFAQSHAEVVAAVKASLEAKHVDLSGPCGALQIVKRVAWQLKDEGAGLLAKPTGNQCEFRAVDIIIYPDGRSFDILTDAGGTNGPAWNPIAPIDASRWRAPSDPGDSPSDPPTDTTPHPATDLTQLAALVDDLRIRFDLALQAQRSIMDALMELDSREHAHAEHTSVAIDSLIQEHRQDNATLLHTIERLDTTLQALRCEAKADLGFARIPIRCEVKH